MAVEITWHNDEHTILHCHMTGHWTWMEYRQALAAITLPDHPLVTLYTFDNLTYLPVNTLSAIMELYKPGIPSRFKKAFVVGHHPLLKANLDIIRSLNGKVVDHFSYAPTAEAALRSIYSYLPQIQADTRPVDDQ